MILRALRAIGLYAAVALLWTGDLVAAQEAPPAPSDSVAAREKSPPAPSDSVETPRRGKPLVRGGYADKPFITRLGGRTIIGGYADAEFRYEREAGITEEVSFIPRRFNVFTYSVVSDRVTVGAEIEFEEMGEEIKLEFATLDFLVHEALSFRGGVILSPLGKFNLAHDSPFSDLVERPLVSTQIISTTLSEPGMGLFGAVYPSGSWRLTYELYGVNGFNEGLIEDSDRTFIPNGRGTIEDNNNRPSAVGRIALSPREGVELGGSFHVGPYNVFNLDGLQVDERRNLSIFALDYELRRGRWELLGEYARARVDVPQPLIGLFARRQQGLYAQVNGHFWRGLFPALPQSAFTATLRYDHVDFDTEARGDSHRKVTVGLNFRPTEDTVFKLNYVRSRVTDAVPISVPGAAILFGVATYF